MSSETTATVMSSEKENALYQAVFYPHFQLKNNLDIIELMVAEAKKQWGAINKLTETVTIQTHSIEEVKKNIGELKQNVKELKQNDEQIKKEVDSTKSKTLQLEKVSIPVNPLLDKKQKAIKMAREELLEEWGHEYSVHNDIRTIARMITDWNMKTIKQQVDSHRGWSVYDHLLRCLCKKFLKYYYASV